jgi:hypothetical protein
MNDLVIEILWWVAASPLLFVRWLVRMVAWIRFLKVAYAPEVRCGNCGEAISLVGIWKCSCHFTYRGHLLRECPICGSTPRMVRCFACGVTERLPEIACD